MSEQLPFEFQFRPAQAAEDFLVAPTNAEAVAWLDRWPQWPAPALAVFGPARCGKTHLARVFKAQTAAVTVTSEGLRSAEPPQILGRAMACVLDDAEDCVLEGLEEPLLHLYNTVAETGRTMLLVSERPPSRWTMGLADLRSRLRAAPAVGIGEPDDALMAAVIVKLFADRQIRLDDGVLSFILPRIERTFAAAQALVDAADAASLASKRAITVPLVRRVLADLESQRNDA
ncbi:MAG: DNA replication protein [Hyphomicrobiales bacterium]|nr:DNA replication protein [Hyphomicrobiales bacterium]